MPMLAAITRRNHSASKKGQCRRKTFTPKIPLVFQVGFLSKNSSYMVEEDCHRNVVTPVL